MVISVAKVAVGANIGDPFAGEPEGYATQSEYHSEKSEYYSAKTLTSTSLRKDGQCPLAIHFAGNALKYDIQQFNQKAAALVKRFRAYLIDRIFRRMPIVV